mgnify:FL=1
MSTNLGIPSSGGANYAPVQPLQRYLDQNGQEQKPFSEWVKTETSKLERLEEGTWMELSLVW